MEETSKTERRLRMARVKVYVVPDKDASIGEKVRCWFKNRKTDAEVFWEEHSDEVLALTPVVLGGAAAAFKFGSKLVNQHREKWLRKHSIWDAREHHWWILKKEPTAWQWSEIERRKKDGETVSSILKSLGLLKK